MTFINKNFCGLNHYTKMTEPASVVRHDIIADQCFKAALVRMNDTYSRFWTEVMVSCTNAHMLATKAGMVHNEMMIMGALMAAHPVRMEARVQWYTKIVTHGFMHYYETIHKRYDDEGRLIEPYKSEAVKKEQEMINEFVGLDNYDEFNRTFSKLTLANFKNLVKIKDHLEYAKDGKYKIDIDYMIKLLNTVIADGSDKAENIEKAKSIDLGVELGMNALSMKERPILTEDEIRQKNTEMVNLYRHCHNDDLAASSSLN
jgi:hypothetical protein